jgi:hypothetical protein
VSYLSLKVTSKVSVSRRRRSPLARSALPFKVSLVIFWIPPSMQSKGTKVVLVEKLFRGKFWRRGGSPLLGPEATARAGTLAKGLAMAVGSARSTQAKASRVPEPRVCFARFATLVLSPFFTSCLKNIVRLSAGFETALNESVKNCEALAQAAEQKEADCMAMSEAILAFCRAFGLDDVPSGSSPQSHLWALGGHVRSIPRRALHHGVRRAFAVFASHYDVDLEWVSEGYCLPDEEEAALAEVQRLDAAVEGPSAVLASSFEVEVLAPVSPSEARPDSAEGGNDAEGAAPPPADV